MRGVEFSLTLAADAERYYGSFFPADEPTPDGSFEEIFKENENKGII
jgi:hypothetical protein